MYKDTYIVVRGHTYSSERTHILHILQESKKKDDNVYTSQAEIDHKLRELDRAKQKVLTLLALLV